MCRTAVGAADPPPPLKMAVKTRKHGPSAGATPRCTLGMRFARGTEPNQWRVTQRGDGGQGRAMVFHGHYLGLKSRYVVSVSDRASTPRR